MKAWLKRVAKKIVTLFGYTIAGMILLILVCWVILGVFSPVLFVMYLLK